MSIYLSHLSLHTTSSPSLAISLGILHPPLISPSMSTSGALTSLNISNNNIGELVAEGWTKGDYKCNGEYEWIHADGRSETCIAPAGAKPEGALLLAEAIKCNGVLTSLNLASNDLGAMGAKYVAEAIKVYVSAPFDTILSSI